MVYAIMSVMQELVKQLKELATQINAAAQQLNIADSLRRAEELERAAEEPTFWNDPASAATKQQELAALRRLTDSWIGMQNRAAELLELASMNDTALTDELAAGYQALLGEYAAHEAELKLSGPYDHNPAIMTIAAGTGGTDAQDWAAILLRMYLRFCERAGFNTVILDQSPGEEAGIKSVTFEVNGPLAYGKLKSEKGVHRLVRLSPFNSDNLRQTSFALVEVMPQLAASEVELDPKDLRIDVYRAGGHGGQSVNTTDSAVRATHVPTGLTVAIQNERSQLQNKDKALAVLRGRLAELMAEQHAEKLTEIKSQNQSAAWGQQIRSYVLHPYTKVKDHRTGHETSQSAEVLDGELEPFIEAFLRSQIGS